MSVLGFDLGNENSYIAVARAGGIETIANEYSQRSTPTYVAFGEKTRDLGVSAKNKQITNVKNTIFNFKRMIGQINGNADIEQQIQYVPFEIEKLASDELGFRVNYMLETHVFTARQIMAMMLTKLKEISETNLRTKVQDCVLSVPVFYTDSERRAILDAAEISGLNVLRLMNETTAVALAYGFYKQDLPEDKPKIVVFIDLGHSALQASACSFTKGKLKILGCTYHRNLGGRDFDNVLVRHFIEDFNKRYKLDIHSNKRAVVRLMQECEKLKKQMSANSLELPINIECFMEDKDVSGRMKREDFENLAAYPIQLIEVTLKKLLHETRLKPEEIDSVQIVGGSSRLPCFKSLIQKIFNKEPSTTLNQDEAVARGCALQCAMLSPTFKVRDFAITDIQPYEIVLRYESPAGEQDSMTKLFPPFHPVPFSKVLTFFRTNDFKLAAFFTEPGSEGIRQIGEYTVKNVVPTPEGDSSKVKVKARINKHGVFSLSSATMYEKQTVVSNEPEKSESQPEKTSPQKNKPKPEEAMDAQDDTGTNGDIDNEVEIIEDSDQKTAEKKETDQKKTKNIVKSIDLPVESSQVYNLSKEKLNDLIEKEAKMILQDKMEKERADAKNAVEEYVYEFRGKLCAELEEFVTQQESENLKKILEETENWLYDEGEDQQKSVYVQKLNYLKKHGDPVTVRYLEWENRPASLHGLGSSLQLVRKALQSYASKEETYDHLTEDEISQVKKVWEEKDQWHGQYLQPFSKLKKYENPPVTVADIQREKQELDCKVWPILSKPKPKVEPPPTENVNGQQQTDSEMQEASNQSEKPASSESQPQSKSQPESMETN